MLKIVCAFAALMLVAALAAPELAPRLLAMLQQHAPASSPLAETQSAGGRMVLKADARGHSLSPVSLNGLSFDGVVDTGATFVSLTYEDGRRLGLVAPGDRFDVAVQTANGTAKAKKVRLNTVRLGSITVRDVDALVASGPGQLPTNLLGMSFLGRLNRFEVRRGQLVLEE